MVPNLITAHADTLRGAAVEIPSGGDTPGCFRAELVPVKRLTVPFTWPGLNLRYDSLSVVGARTEYFDAVTTVGLDLVNKVSTVVLRAGNQPPLTAGDGTVLSLWFTANSASTGINEIAFITDGSYSPTFESGENVYRRPWRRVTLRGASRSAVAKGGSVMSIESEGMNRRLAMLCSGRSSLRRRQSSRCVEEADINQSGGGTPTYGDSPR